MHLTLRHKINGAILITFLLIAVLFAAIQIPFRQKHLEQTMDHIQVLLETMVERDREELANEIFDGRISAIAIRLEEMRKVDGILNISVFDKDGNLLVSEGTQSVQKNFTADEIEVLQKGTLTRQQKSGRENVLLFSQEIRFLAEHLGFISIQYSLREVEKIQKSNFIFFGSLLGVTLIVMLTILNLILSRAIIRPVMALKDATRFIVSGNYDNRIHMPRKDELGDLAGGFDAMRLAVKEKIDDLQRLTDKYRQLYQEAPVMLHTVDAEGQIVEVNNLWMETMGFSRDEVVGQPTLVFLTEKSRQQAFEERCFLDTREAIKDRPFQMVTRNGSVLDVLISAFSQKDDTGAVVRSTISTQDITALKKAENALQERERQLRMLTENMVDVISQTDADANIIYTSPSIKRVLGYTPKELEGKPASDYIHPDDIDPIFTQVANARQRKAGSVLLQYRWRHLDGSYRWVESATRLLYDRNGEARGAILGTRDIDAQKRAAAEKKALESQLALSQKLESIGRLAGGVAHDLNNLLTPILGYSEMLIEKTGEGDPSRQKLLQIKKSGIRARDLVRQLLAFSRKQTLKFTTVDINLVLVDFEILLRRTIRESIEIHLNLSEQLKPVLADTGQLEQVIMNLALNAADAMPDGGRLTIETRTAVLDEAYASSRSGVIPGEYVLMSFSDTGHGMEEKISLQIFEPFFSTKGDQGTGLGLATVYGIVKQHQGNIWVYSEVGKGTTFEVYLPVTGISKNEPHPDVPVNPRLSGDETILLVEDDVHVLELAHEILTDQGYTVLTAKNGKEALETFSSDAFSSGTASIDLLLTDVVMPELNGKELFSLLSEQHPDLKVLYMSGYTNDIITHHGVLDEGLQFIQKPFTVYHLARKVREVLQS